LTAKPLVEPLSLLALAGTMMVSPVFAQKKNPMPPAKSVRTNGTSAAMQPGDENLGGDPSESNAVLTVEELGRDVPSWAKEKLPAWVERYVGTKGLGSAWIATGPLAANAGPFLRWEANRFIAYRPETAKFLYEQYSSLTVNARRKRGWRW
jgi:hypothetical protein